jgi:hypothetical protein
MTAVSSSTLCHSGQPAGVRPCARRLAQGVLSREEPEESFLKGVPTEPDSLELVFPVPAPTCWYADKRCWDAASVAELRVREALVWRERRPAHSLCG